MESNIGERVKAEREARGWTQDELARRVTRAGFKISQGGIAQIERRGDSEPKCIVQLGIALGRTPRYLQTGKGPKGPTLPDADESPMRREPQVDTVTIHELDVHAAAGLGTDMDGDIMATEEAGAVVGSFSFPSSGFREAYGAQPDGVKMIAVRGDSMIPTLWPGQRCMVDTNDRIPSPPGVFVVWDGMGLVLKRLELIPGSGDPMRVRIMSDNPKYTAYERTLDEAHINGRVVGVWARM